MLNVLQQLPRNRQEMEAHLDALAKLRSSPEHEALFNHLYGVLSILDAKAASLLAFNAIGIAIFAIFLSGGATGLVSWTAHIGTAFVVGSSLLLLWVARVHWSTTEDLGDARSHCLRLLDLRKARTIKYRLAWILSVCSVGMLVLLLVVR